MARFWKSDYRIRVDRSRKDSHVNEAAERTSYAIGDALEMWQLFTGMSTRYLMV